MICGTCHNSSSSLHNDDCWECYQINEAAWRKRVATRMDPTQFDLPKLLLAILPQMWMHACLSG